MHSNPTSALMTVALLFLLGTLVLPTSGCTEASDDDDTVGDDDDATGDDDDDDTTGDDDDTAGDDDDSAASTDADGDGYADDVDCDDLDADVHPGAAEIPCDDVDNDCDAATGDIPDDDGDCDGVLTADDCDDADDQSTYLAIDGDCDGVLTADDCDDADDQSTYLAIDGDCDGVLTADDCDDADDQSTYLAIDGDCDGILTADDCDDADDQSTYLAIDGDCDGILTADDCDDADDQSNYLAIDGDCDGVLTADDCDDADPLLGMPGDDLDGDGVCNPDDQCDGDDAWGDADRDGICADRDNCDDRPNPNQEDVCDVWFVDDDAVGAGDGTSWVDAFTSVQDAIDAAIAGERLFIAEGIYPPDAANTVVATFADLALYGGFEGVEMTLEARAGLTDETLLTGDFLGDDDGTLATVADNAPRIVQMSGTFTLDGLTIARAYTDSERGAGARADGSVGGRIVGVIFRENEAPSYGGGLYAYGGTLEVVDSLFMDNTSGDQAGGLMVADAQVTIRNSTFLGNVAGSKGSAISTIGGSPSFEIQYCTFVDNSGGATIFADSGNTFTIRNSAIYGGDSVLSTGGGGPTVIVDHTCAAADLSGYGVNNVHLDDSTDALSDPFALLGHRVLLKHAAAGDPWDSACVDAADPSTADTDLPGWDALSTRTDDVADAGDPDSSRHYAPDTSVCIGDDTSGDTDGDGICNDLDP